MARLVWSHVRTSMGALVKSRRPLTEFNSFAQLNSGFCTSQSIQSEGNGEELDKLYRAVVLEVRSNDKEVLRSYEAFAKMASAHLDVNLSQIFEPETHIYRQTLLRSKFIYKKHRVQYEWRTHYKVFEFKHLTSSTADTLLEYLQRNLPEGCDMKVNKHALEPLPPYMVKGSPNTDGQPAS